MTPIPSAVAAAIVAAGHSLSAEPVTVSGYGRPEWRWSMTDGSVKAPVWDVEVGGRSGRAASPRAATLAALARVASEAALAEAKARAEFKRVRLPYRKAQETERADAAAKRAADVRALAATVAALWPEVTP